MTGSTKSDSCGTYPIGSNLFRYLTDEELARVNDKRKQVLFHAGETIFKSGGPLTHLICLNSGMVKVHLEEPRSKRILLSIIKPVTMIRGPGFLVDYRHYLTVTAIEDSSACFIDVDEIKKIMLNNARFSMELAKDLNKLIIKYLDRISCITHKHMHGKLANSLLYLADDVYESLSFETKLTRQDIGEMSAMTKESVVRILKEFKEDGIIEYSIGNFNILNKEKLLKMSQNG
jgi:CRP/FNR family transcriptional regulator